MVERQHDQRDAGTLRRIGDAQRLMPAVRRLGAVEAVILQQIAQPLARADRIAGEDRLLALFAQRAEVLDHRFVDVRAARPLGREIARAVDAEVEHARAFGLVEGRGQMRMARLQPRRPFLGVEVQGLRGERPIAAGLCSLSALAVFVIIGDRLHSPLDRAGHAEIAHDDVVGGQMVEQRRQFVFEQRQPMLHAGKATPIADRLVQWIAGRGRTELVAIARAEALDRFLVEQRLGRGQQREAVDPAGGTLILGAERTYRLDLVAEEVEAQRLLFPARIQVDDAAAHGIFALIVDGFGAHIAVCLEQLGKIVAIDPRAWLQRRHQLAYPERRQHTLRRRIGGRQDELRTLGRALQPVERRDPLRHDPQRRRGAVIGQAVPGREDDHLQFGREERRRRRDGAHRGIVRRDEHRTPLRCAGKVGEQRRLKPGGHARQRQRRLGGQDRLEVGHHGPWKTVR